MSSIFKSLQVRNYRIWFYSNIVSNIGTWTQKIAQDWLVIAILTNNSATTLGITMALQFGPQVLLTPFTGLIADKLNLKKVLIVTQFLQCMLAVALSTLWFTGNLTLWHMQLIALCLGIVSAFDMTARQTFISTLVSYKYLTNAISLSSTTMNLAKMVAPSISGLLVAVVGPGWCFIINSVSFLFTIVTLFMINSDDLLITPKRSESPKNSLLTGFKYVKDRPDLLGIIIGVLLLSSFAFNFQTYVAKIATVTFKMGSGGYGLLCSAFAIGSVVGSLTASTLKKPRTRFFLISSVLFGLAITISAFMPHWYFYIICLPFGGAFGQFCLTNANTYVQLYSNKAMRGRVMAIYLAVFMVGTPIGSPIVGIMCDVFSPQISILFCGLSAMIIIYFIWLYLKKKKSLELHFNFKQYKKHSKKYVFEQILHLSFLELTSKSS